ncbi:hypothetical protein PAXRUDRAFT_155311, partial [Paxillus rubicundulus Ve08.2h10]
SISITISPLKRLQTSQVLECQKYAISTIAINEDPMNVLTSHDRRLSGVIVLIVPAKELFTSSI